MSNVSVAVIGAAAVLALLVGGPARAQGDADLEIDVADCLEIESPSERFRCYESRVDAALRERGGAEDSAAAAAERPEEAPAQPAARASEEPAARAEPRANVVAEREIDIGGGPSSDFGFRREEPEEEAEEEREELYGTIAALRETIPNTYVITLENGQIWRQNMPKWYPLQVGYRVRIYPTRWGSSYRLQAEELNGFIQVERVR